MPWKEKCFPQINEVNFCGIFTGALYVYGKNQNEQEISRKIMSYVNEVLDTSEPRELHPELTVLSRVDKFSEVEGANKLDSEKGTMSRLDVLLVIVSAMIVAAMIYYVYIQRNERKFFDPKSAVGNERELPSDISIVSEGKHDNDDRFIDEDLHIKQYRDV